MRILLRTRQHLAMHWRWRAIPRHMQYQIEYRVADVFDRGIRSHESEDQIILRAQDDLRGFLPPWAMWILGTIIAEVIKKLMAELLGERGIE